MNSSTPYKFGSLRQGLSMLEVIVSLTLVAGMMLVSLTASANMMRNRTMSQTAVDSHRLAGYFLDEISTLDYREASEEAVFGPEPGESDSDRTSYDDIDDFHGFRQSAPTFRDGEPIPGYGEWTINVAVISLAYSESGYYGTTDAESQFRWILVAVTGPDASTSIHRTIVSNTITDRKRSTSFERLRRVHVRFSDDRALDMVVPLRNTPPPVYQ